MASAYDELRIPEPAAFIHESISHVEIMHVFGEIDIANSAEFEAALARAWRFGRPLAVDLMECAYIDASALSVFLRAQRALSHRLRIAAKPQSAPDRLLRLTELDRVFTLAPSLDEALRLPARFRL